MQETISKSRIFGRVREKLFNIDKVDFDYWSEKCEIPIGTKKPYHYYEGTIPDSEIVTIPFDSANKPMTERKAFNTLVLGGSGDGKSLLEKIFWYVLHKANYKTCYIDSKSADSGRAKLAWNSPRLPPTMKPEGIDLEHYMPYWATKDYQHMAHNFKLYSMGLPQINDVEMWFGLGAKDRGASLIVRTIRKMQDEGEEINIDTLADRIFLLKEKTGIFAQLPQQTLDNIMRTLVDLQEWQFINHRVPNLELKKVWNRGKAVAISYNNANKKFMTFDIGYRIHQAVEYLRSTRNPSPVMFFFDDASLYADKFPQLYFNYCLKEIENIGNIYRSLGANNLLAVQNLQVITDEIAQTYRWKLISPVFQDIEHLKDINVNPEVISILRHNKLVKDKKNHLLQWIVVNEDNEWTWFFPFTPNCHHFVEVYRPRMLGDDNDEI